MLFLTTCYQHDTEAEGGNSNEIVNNIEHNKKVIIYDNETKTFEMCGPTSATKTQLPDGRILITEIPTLCTTDPWYYDEDFGDITEINKILTEQYIDVYIIQEKTKK
jgi:hypothetical protein